MQVPCVLPVCPRHIVKPSKLNRYTMDGYGIWAPKYIPLQPSAHGKMYTYFVCSCAVPRVNQFRSRKALVKRVFYDRELPSRYRYARYRCAHEHQAFVCNFSVWPAFLTICLSFLVHSKKVWHILYMLLGWYLYKHTRAYRDISALIIHTPYIPFSQLRPNSHQYRLAATYLWNILCTMYVHTII